jgi:hypothetical protein
MRFELKKEDVSYISVQIKDRKMEIPLWSLFENAFLTDTELKKYADRFTTHEDLIEDLISLNFDFEKIIISWLNTLTEKEIKEFSI